MTPVWPNLTEIPRILGAEVVRVGLRSGRGRWRLDLDELIAAITPETRLSSSIRPAIRPAGRWRRSSARPFSTTAAASVWLLADDVYERLYYRAKDRAVLLALADEDDRVVGANSFSKAWLMTGWRLAGW